MLRFRHCTALALSALIANCARPAGAQSTPVALSQPESPVANRAESAALESEPTNAEPPEIELVTEAPYKLYERSVHPGEVYAAGQDEALARWNLGGTSDPQHASNRPGFHPGTRVVVDLQQVHGRLPRRARHDRTGRPRTTLSEERLLAEARKNGYWSFRLCFEDGLRAAANLTGSASRIRARISPTGRVVGARVLETELSRKSVAECVAQRFKKLRFTPPPRRIDAVFDVKFWPGDAKLPSRACETTTSPDECSNPGRLNATDVERALAPQSAAIRACFAEGVARDPGLWGRLELRVALDASGRLTSIGEGESRFSDREVTACVQNALKAADFIAPSGGPVRFVYAFRLGHAPSERLPIPEQSAAVPVSDVHASQEPDSLGRR